jgi:hypothetical protein
MGDQAGRRSPPRPRRRRIAMDPKWLFNVVGDIVSIFLGLVILVAIIHGLF